MAQELCQSKKGQLSRIDSEEMKNFVAKHLNGKELWINGQKNNDGVWKYLDGTNITVQFWIEDEPDDSGKCLRVVSEGGWRDKACSKSYGYICEKI
ncbi:C-type lectin domain family 10 member A-like [Dreissena polymorpha]|uniref:C-type lectin domain family 10 member A-like n=1 Tax=Dreissena polymorpha TaxID=45954 RepID=UPI00226455B7|nr:C-type lectin domain family 10 member A-like [Dreissena polymorpha]